MNLYSRSFTSSTLKAITTLGAVFYFVLLLYIFFLARRRRGPTLPWSKRHLNLIPMKSKFEYFVSQYNIADQQLREFYIDFFGNIILFIPFAFFLYFFFRIKEPRKVITIALIFSVSIELIQFVLSIGVADIDDVILNVAGSTIGVLFLNLLTKVKTFKKILNAL